MRLSAWIEEFLLSLRVEREATPRTVETYHWCLRDFEAFAGKQNGGTVLITHFTEELKFLSEEDKDWVMGRAIVTRLGWA